MFLRGISHPRRPMGQFGQEEVKRGHVTSSVPNYLPLGLRGLECHGARKRIIFHAVFATVVTLSSAVPLDLWRLDTLKTRMNSAADLTSEGLDSCA